MPEIESENGSYPRSDHRQKHAEHVLGNVEELSRLFVSGYAKRIDAADSLTNERYPEAIYYAYTGFVIAAKALLLSKDVECNTQIKILQDFDKTFVETNEFTVEGGFENLVLSINQNEPSLEFAASYVGKFNDFLKNVIAYREKMLNNDGDKMVVESNYKA